MALSRKKKIIIGVVVAAVLGIIVIVLIVLVVLANDVGFGSDVSLRYAEADAARLVETLSELGSVDRVRAINAMQRRRVRTTRARRSPGGCPRRARG